MSDRTQNIPSASSISSNSNSVKKTLDSTESVKQERFFRFSLTGFEIKGHNLQEEETLMKRVWRFYVLEFLAAIFLVIAAIYLKDALWIAAIPAIGSKTKSWFSKQPP